MGDLRTFEDKLGREQFAEKIKAILENDKNKSLSLGITGQYGCGKTCALSFLKTKLESNKDNIVFYFNAWEYDYFQQPLLGLIDSISPPKKLSKLAGKTYDKLKESAVTLSAKGVGILADTHISPGLGKLVNWAKKIKLKPSSDTVTEPGFEIKRNIKDFRDQLQSYRNSLFSNKQKRIYILIDELDRCRPKFVVDFLEIFQHILHDGKEILIDNISYVISYDHKELCNIVKHAYGDIDMEHYMRRFFDYRYKIPFPSDYSEYIDSLLISDRLETILPYAQNLKSTLSAMGIFSLRLIEKSLYIIKDAIAYETNLFVGQASDSIVQNNNVALKRSEVINAYFAFLYLKLDDNEKYNNMKDYNENDRSQIYKNSSPNNFQLHLKSRNLNIGNVVPGKTLGSQGGIEQFRKYFSISTLPRPYSDGCPYHYIMYSIEQLEVH